MNPWRYNSMKWLKLLLGLGGDDRKRGTITGSKRASDGVIVTDNPRALDNGTEFRKPDDGDHIIRIRNPWPGGLQKVNDYVKVSGVSRYQKKVHRFIRGDNRRVELEREPDNEYDENAIRVIGMWEENGADRRAHIGYVERKTAQRIAENYPEAEMTAFLYTIFKPRPGRSAGLRLDVFVPDGR